MLHALRKNCFSLMVVNSDLKKFSDMTIDKLGTINDYATLKMAMKLFQPKAGISKFENKQEAFITKRLDELVMKISDQLTALDWVDLLNTKSILRERNQNLLESCAYKLTLLNDEKAMSLDSIQRILLSCSLLKFHNVPFYKFLLDKLSVLVTKHKEDSEWFAKSEKTLFHVINSLGMLKLKDKALLEAICDLLNNCGLNSDALIISFVKSCAALDYKPTSAFFDQLISKIRLANFKVDSEKEKSLLLDYVWSLCEMKLQNTELVTAVLTEDFWKKLLQSNYNLILSRIKALNLFMFKFWV